MDGKDVRNAQKTDENNKDIKAMIDIISEVPSI